MNEIVMDICEICNNNEVAVWNYKYEKRFCRSCSRRADTWGVEGARELIEMAKQSESIDINCARQFCYEHYIGKAIQSAEKVATMRIALAVLGAKGKIVGRHRRKDRTYERVRGALAQHYKRHNAKKDCCEDCGSKGTLEIHHVIPVSWGGVEIDPDYVKTLCFTCHRKAHKKLRTVLTRLLLIDYLRPHFDEIKRLVASVA